MLVALLALSAAACGTSQRKTPGPAAGAAGSQAGAAGSPETAGQGGSGGVGGKAGSGAGGGAGSGGGDHGGRFGEAGGGATATGAGGSAGGVAAAGAGGSSAGAGSGGAPYTCPEEPAAAGGPAVSDCEVPRDDCDRHASCLNVDGFDRCVCDDEYFGDGLLCDGPPVALAVSTSYDLTCVVLGSGTVRCFGHSDHGALGLDGYATIGDDEPASAAPLLAFSEPVKDVAVGELTPCVLFQNGDVRCWGYDGGEGQLGSGEQTIDSPWDETGNVRLGGKAVALSGTGRHHCAILEDGALRCWGSNYGDALGYGSGDYRETPDVEGDLPLPGRVIDVSATNGATCAVLEDGSVYCWGSVRFYLDGQLAGAASAAEARVIDVGASVKQVAAANDHVCVLTEAGNVRCFGENFMGQLGYKIFNEPIGDDESIDSAGDVDVGGEVKQVVAGSAYTCALLTTGAVRCWGRCGAYAYGNCEPIGDNETPAETGDALLGGSVARLSAGSGHVCALMTDGSVRCWGEDNGGQLGYGVEDDVGDLVPPACAGTVPVF